MTDEALHFVSGAAEQGSAKEAASPHDLFARVLLGRPPNKRSAFLVRWSRTEASREVAAGRVPVDTAEVAAYRLLYGAARKEASAVRSTDAVEGSTRWERAMAGLATLRHRQRAAVALRFLAGLSLAEVAQVLGIREGQARGVVEAGVAGIVRAVGGPIDVRRALRIAAQRLITPPKPAEAAPPPPAVMPRRVMRALLARPPLLAPRTVPGGRSPVEALIAPLPAPESAAPAPEPAAPAPEAEIAAAVAVAEPVKIPEPAAPPPLPAPTPVVVSAPAPPTVLRPRTKIARPLNRDALPRRLAIAIAVALLCAAALAPASARPVVGEPKVVAAAAMFTSSSEDEALMEARRLFALLPAADAGLTVRRGDTLWSISARALGDAYRWGEIWAVNRGRSMGGGERFINPAVIRPGWRLKIPR